MISPECLYWIVLALMVAPSLPFNRIAIVVLCSWAFGHFVHMTGPYENMGYMFAQIVGCGAALGLWVSDTVQRRSYARLVSSLLFAPMAALSFAMAMYCDDPPATMDEYYLHFTLYWSLWSLGFAQAISIPFGNDWHRIKELAKRLDDAILRRIDKHFNGAL